MGVVNPIYNLGPDTDEGLYSELLSHSGYMDFAPDGSPDRALPSSSLLPDDGTYMQVRLTGTEPGRNDGYMDVRPHPDSHDSYVDVRPHPDSHDSYVDVRPQPDGHSLAREPLEDIPLGFQDEDVGYVDFAGASES